MSNKNNNRVYIYDTTLRDGAQTRGVNFRLIDKIKISELLDSLPVDYIEGGWPGANPTDEELFSNLPKLKNAKFTAFGMTKKHSTSAANDHTLSMFVNSGCKTACMVGKSSIYQVKNALGITEKQNLEIIADSIKYLREKKLEVMFDAEHFFDGFQADEEATTRIVQTAIDAGASWIVLCDTNGGSLPGQISDAVKKIIYKTGYDKFGIHCHNDTGCAVANSIAAVEAGVRMVQGTINGLGERCGNADIITIIPNLMLKLGYDLGIKKENLKNLVKLSNYLDDVLNRERNPYAPYVGSAAFTHKGGLHASAVTKDASTYEHIEPEIVGNRRNIVVSNQAGKASLLAKLIELKLIKAPEALSDDQVNALIKKIKEKESEGYVYDGADASFAVLVRGILEGTCPEPFTIETYKVLIENIRDKKSHNEGSSEAIVKICAGEKNFYEIAEGNGPVSALDHAIRKALVKIYPGVTDVELTDYRVRVMSHDMGVNASIIVRISFQSKKDGEVWSTVGVSGNIIEASYIAIIDGIRYRFGK